MDLIALYQSAVEYYNSIGDNTNSQIYQEKIKFVFLKPHISKMFNVGKDKKSPKNTSLKAASNEQDDNLLR